METERPTSSFWSRTEKQLTFISMLKREVIENWDLIYDLGTVPQKLRPVEVQDLGASLLYLHITWGDGSSVGTWGWSGLENCYNYN